MPTRRARRGSTARITLPILIHGDAAFPGQGIVAETLNLSRLAGYDTGGTIHIIANNQLGFTATPAESYSTSYASGLARGFKIPIVHVNADDPVACLEAARLAWEYRARFRRDFLIDLVGYRRYGHNEGDEPAFTQPVMYKKVAAHPTVRELFGRDAGRAGHSAAGAAGRSSCKKHFAVLEKAFAIAQARGRLRRADSRGRCRPASPAATQTGVPLERLREINDALLAAPAGLHVPQEARTRPRAAQASARRPGRAHDRLGHGRRAGAGHDPGRRRRRSASPARTSSAAPSAIATPSSTTPAPASELVPLQEFPQAKASFEIHNSPLTENADDRLRVRLQHPGAGSPGASGKRSTATSSTARR